MGVQGAVARSGFQSVPVPDTGLLLGNNTIIDAKADPPVVTPLPSLAEQSRDLNTKHISFPKFLALVVEGYVADPALHEHTHKLQQVGQYWFKENALALPDYADLRASALYQMHDAPWSAHVSRTRTLAVLRTVYWWPSMADDVATYVASCDSCQRNKAHHSTKNNLLVPLPVPERPFQIIGVDFITCLPTTARGFDAICVIVCH